MDEKKIEQVIEDWPLVASPGTGFQAYERRFRSAYLPLIKERICTPEDGTKWYHKWCRAGFPRDVDAYVREQAQIESQARMSAGGL